MTKSDARRALDRAVTAYGDAHLVRRGGAAAAYAAAAAARKKALAAMAEIVRRHYPKAPRLS